jgi:hypothetical protein
MIHGISAVAVRLLQVVENGRTHIIAEPKGQPQTEFYTNGFFRVEEAGDTLGHLFFVFETGEEVWGNTPEEMLAHVNEHIRAGHH